MADKHLGKNLGDRETVGERVVLIKSVINIT